MKTFDGYDAIKNKYYYLVTGQCVALVSAVTDSDGNEFFSVTPFYEGETMMVSGAGGSHREHTAGYKCEGEMVIVDKIFQNAPIEKLCSQYKKSLEKIQTSAQTFGELSSANKKLELEISRNESKINAQQRQMENVKQKIEQAKEYLDSKFSA